MDGFKKSRTAISNTHAPLNNVNDQVLDLYLEEFLSGVAGPDYILLFPANPAGNFCRYSEIGKALHSGGEQ
jgi:hypothetical protein